VEVHQKVPVRSVEVDDQIRIYVTSALRQRTCCEMLDKMALDLRLEGMEVGINANKNFVRDLYLVTFA